jgi:hypothetical protein
MTSFLLLHVTVQNVQIVRIDYGVCDISPVRFCREIPRFRCPRPSWFSKGIARNQMIKLNDEIEIKVVKVPL